MVTRGMRRTLALTLLITLAGATFWAQWGFDLYYRQGGVNAWAPTATAEKADGTTHSSALVARGQYLARVGNCVFCHTAPGGAMLAGGRAIQTPFGTVFTSNLTPDPLHGMGRWTPDDFWQALHLGWEPTGNACHPHFHTRAIPASLAPTPTRSTAARSRSAWWATWAAARPPMRSCGRSRRWCGRCRRILKPRCRFI